MFKVALCPEKEIHYPEGDCNEAEVKKALILATMKTIIDRYPSFLFSCTLKPDVHIVVIKYQLSVHCGRGNAVGLEKVRICMLAYVLVRLCY